MGFQELSFEGGPVRLSKCFEYTFDFPPFSRSCWNRDAEQSSAILQTSHSAP